MFHVAEGKDPAAERRASRAKGTFAEVGQVVDLVPRVLRAAAPGQYEVRRLMPQSDRDAGDPSYQIKSIDEKHERVVFESGLTLSARSEFFA